MREATVTAYRKTIFELIKADDYVTFAGIMRVLGEQAKGAVAIEQRPNVVLWANMSPEVVEAILDLLEKGLIRYQPTAFLTYMIDGGVLLLPVARRIPKNGYKAPHWLPVCFRAIA